MAEQEPKNSMPAPEPSDSPPEPVSTSDKPSSADATDETEGSNSSSGSVPVAVIKPSTKSRIELLTIIGPLVCLAGAILLAVWSHKPTGVEIVITFEEGHGIQAGNILQHRGIEVGTVTEVTLAEDSQKVSAHVELDLKAKSLAKEGSQFWIVRPQVSLTRIAGLDTVVGAKYIGVQPAPAGAAAKFEFVGLETPLTLIDDQAVDITIQFKHGNGLQQGDVVRHRDIIIGEVTNVELSQNFNGVIAHVRLKGTAGKLAKKGTRFWVERPTISVAEIRGLDTLVGGRYIAVQPALGDSEKQTDFVGLDIAPPAELPEGGLEIILEAKQRAGLQRGVPVLYRGLRVGHVTNVTLASDAATIEATAWVEQPYKHLIRKNTKFWSSGGFDISVGLTGVQIDADTLSSIMLGGISLATPDRPGSFVNSGHRFDCANDPDEEWLEWQPHLPLGLEDVAGDKPLPKPIRATLKWEKRVFGFRTDREKKGWLLPLSNGKLLGPADMLTPVEVAVDGQTLETEGKRFPVTAKITKTIGRLAVLTPPEAIVAVEESWPNSDLQVPSEPIDCLVVTTGVGQHVSLAAARLTAREKSWLVEPSVGLTEYHHGAVVVSRADGSVIGIVHITDGIATVELLPARP